MFSGLYTALITPFDDKLSVDFESLKNLLTMQFNARVSGIILFGTTGEGVTLSFHEREQVIQYALQHINDLTMQSKLLIHGKPYRPQIIVGTGTNCTATTIEQSMQAEKLGANAVMIVTPYYNRPSQEGLYQHYKAVNDAIHIPIILYNVPTRTGVNIEDATLLKLMTLANVRAFKDYDSLRPIRLYIDWSQTQNLSIQENFVQNAYANHELFVAACCDKFSILAGDDVNSLSIYVNGGHGCASVASNILPDICHELHQAAKSFDMKRAQAIHAHMYPIYNMLFCEVNPVPVKYAAYKIGLIKTPNVRQPLYELSADSKARVNDLLNRYSLIKS